MANIPPAAQCIAIFSRKTQAAYAWKKLADRGFIVGVRSRRGEHEVFGFIPEHTDLVALRKMAIEFGMAR